MKTPLFFKLVLLLALGLRLIYVAKKDKKNKQKRIVYLDLNSVSKGDLKLDADEEKAAIETLKEAYRKQVRPLAREQWNKSHWLIFVADSFIRSYKKRGVFRYLWHQNYLAFAFYQSLVLVEFHKEAKMYSEVIAAYCSTDVSQFDPLNAEENLLFPNAEIESQTQKEFDKTIDTEAYARAILKFINNES